MLKLKTLNALWFAYAVVLLLLGAAQSIHKISEHSGGVMSQWGPIIGTGILAFGLWAWRVQKPILKRWIWQCLWVLLLLSYLFLLVLFCSFIFSGAFSVYFYFVLAALLLLLPCLYGGFRYAFRSASLWGQENVR